MASANWQWVNSDNDVQTSADSHHQLVVLLNHQVISTDDWRSLYIILLRRIGTTYCFISPKIRFKSAIHLDGNPTIAWSFPSVCSALEMTGQTNPDMQRRHFHKQQRQKVQFSEQVPTCCEVCLLLLCKTHQQEHNIMWMVPSDPFWLHRYGSTAGKRPHCAAVVTLLTS